jgi:multidrug resistance efflux pump
MPKNDHIADVMIEYNGNGHNHYPPDTSTLYEVNSEEVQDIMSKMPHWIIRYGTTILFVLVILLFAGAYFIHYPDVVVTNVNITSSNPPLKVVASTNGRIQRIFIQNNQLVKRDESLCLLENPARYTDILLLKSILARLDTTLSLREMIRTISFTQQVQLGELQPGYADLYQAVQQYMFFIERNFISQKVGQLQSQLEYQSELNKELQSRDTFLKQQLMLEKKKFEADSYLVKEKVIAPLEFDNSRKELIDKQMNADATKSGIIQNKLQQTEYIKTITDLQQQKLQQENDLQQKIREDVKRLQGQLEVWEQKYLMKSPVDGKAVFFNVWKENQYVSNGDAVLMIVPPVQNYVAKASLPVYGAGKVKVGQNVLIKLSSYPFEEFGMVRGSVHDVSTVALDTAYSMEIQLTGGLTTTLQKTIPPQPQLTGVAEILTSDKNILERLFEKLWIENKN